jgi:hypothetical protein
LLLLTILSIEMLWAPPISSVRKPGGGGGGGGDTGTGKEDSHESDLVVAGKLKGVIVDALEFTIIKVTAK